MARRPKGNYEAMETMNIWDFRTPNHLRISSVPLCRGCGYFLELHKQKVIVLKCCFAATPKSIYQEKKTKCGLDILLTYYMELPNT